MSMLVWDIARDRNWCLGWLETWLETGTRVYGDGGHSHRQLLVSSVMGA